MEPYVRDFVDPLEGLLLQLEELEAFARAVPKLIEDHRQTVWEEVMGQPGDPDEDPLDVYADAVGEDTGGGFANFERTIYVASVVLGFETFKDFLALNLAGRQRAGRYLGRTTVRDALEEELTAMEFPRLVARFKDQNVYARRLLGWDEIEEIQFTRNSLVHNHGRYTRQYFSIKSPRYPTKDDMFGMDYTQRMSEGERREWLVDREDIPLNLQYVAESLHRLAAFAQLVGEA